MRFEFAQITSDTLELLCQRLGEVSDVWEVVQVLETRDPGSLRMVFAAIVKRPKAPN